MDNGWGSGETLRDEPRRSDAPSGVQNWPASRIGGWFFHRTDPRGPVPQATRNAAGLPAGQTLADAGMAAMLRTYAVYGEEPARVQRVTDMTARPIDEGCRDPIVWESWARIEATPGQPHDLEAAIRACEPG